MGLFSKKNCSVCGGDIGLFGNTKLSDGNLCKNCAGKLSPFFRAGKSVSVEQIEEQLAYREENQTAVAAFNITRTLGKETKIHIDEDAAKFVVTKAKSLQNANPDVMDISDVTNVMIDISENRTELTTTDKEGNTVHMNPPHYKYKYDFDVVINVNNPYFNEIRFDLGSVTTEGNRTSDVSHVRPGHRDTAAGVQTETKPDPMKNVEYKELKNLGEEIKEVLMSARSDARKEVKAEAVKVAAKHPVTCHCCGATTLPDAKNCCEYCGTYVGEA